MSRPIQFKISVWILFVSLFVFGVSSVMAKVLSSASTESQGTEPAAVQASTQIAQSEDDSEDHVAKILDLQGDVRVLKSGAENWIEALREMRVEAGDEMMTGVQSHADIAYDPYYLNVTHIQENTRAEFVSIEPTQIRLSDGAILSALDGLPAGAEYQIMTPTAVAAVRGTHFDVSFNAQEQAFSAATIPEEGKEENQSRVFVLRSGADQKESPVELVGGRQMDLKSGQKPRPDFIRPIEGMRTERARTAFRTMEQRRPDFAARREQGFRRREELRQGLKPLRERKPNSEGRPESPQSRLSLPKGGPGAPRSTGDGPVDSARPGVFPRAGIQGNRSSGAGVLPPPLRSDADRGNRIQRNGTVPSGEVRGEGPKKSPEQKRVSRQSRP